MVRPLSESRRHARSTPLAAAITVGPGYGLSRAETCDLRPATWDRGVERPGAAVGTAPGMLAGARQAVRPGPTGQAGGDGCPSGRGPGGAWERRVPGPIMGGWTDRESKRLKS